MGDAGEVGWTQWCGEPLDPSFCAECKRAMKRPKPGNYTNMGSHLYFRKTSLATREREGGEEVETLVRRVLLWRQRGMGVWIRCQL